MILCLGPLTLLTGSAHAAAGKKTGSEKVVKPISGKIRSEAGLKKIAAMESVQWKSHSYTGTGTGGAVKGGDLITYTLHIRNTGTDALNNVILTDVIPANTDFVTAEGGITPDGAGKLTWIIPTIASGAPDETRFFIVRVRTNLDGVFNISNTAYVDNGNGTGEQPTLPASAGDPNEPGSGTGPSSMIPVDNGKNSVQWKSAGYIGSGSDGTIIAGDVITYTIHVRNTGTVDLTNVTITDLIPVYTFFIEADGGIMPNGSGQLTWNIAEVEVGATVTVSFKVRVDTDLTGATSITNTAYVDNGNGKGALPTGPSVPGDPDNPLPNPPAGPSTSIPIVTKSSFESWKRVLTASGTTTVGPGEQLTYIIYVRNTGNVTIPTLTVNDPVPLFTTFVSAADGGTYSGEGSKIVTWVINNLAAGATATVRFIVNVDTRLEGVKQIANTAQVANTDTTSFPTKGCDPALPDCDGKVGTFIQVAGSRAELFISNVVTPNNDGKNDYFIVRGLDQYPGSALYVFNRWGNQVYQSKDYKNNWSPSGISEGTYYYRLEMNQLDGVKIFKGWVMIIR